jgi:hypothetical protein
MIEVDAAVNHTHLDAFARGPVPGTRGVNVGHVPLAGRQRIRSRWGTVARVVQRAFGIRGGLIPQDLRVCRRGEGRGAQQAYE